MRNSKIISNISPYERKELGIFYDYCNGLDRYAWSCINNAIHSFTYKSRYY